MQNDRDRLIELIRQAVKEYKCLDYELADYLLANGVIVPPVKVDDTVYDVAVGDEGWFIEENKVTEVCSKGYFVSAYDPPMDDLGSFELYEEIGKSVFLTSKEAEKALKEKQNAGTD